MPKSTERTRAKLPWPSAGEADSRFFVAPESRARLHTGPPDASGCAAGAEPSTVAPVGGVKVAIRFAPMPSL